MSKAKGRALKKKLGFGEGKTIYKSKGFDKAEKKFNEERDRNLGKC